MLNKNLALLTLVIFAAGCGLEAKTYVMTKDRVGLDQGSGNGGCIMGKCAPQPAPTKTTRKIYVLEITKPVPESEVKKIEEVAVNAIADTSDTSATPAAEPTASAPAADNSQPAATPGVNVPVVGELPGSTTGSEEAETTSVPSASSSEVVAGGTYTVQKDDTLQKISKKVYGTYSKWYRIYKANKNKIKNPNFVKPGTVLTIPGTK